MAINTNAVDLFSYFPGIEVSDQDIMEAELLLYQTLQAKYPTLDLREGTGIRDLLLRPSASLLAMMNKASLLFFQNNTLDAVTDSTPTTFVDSILSNWFMTRKVGEKAVINVRLYFAKSKNVIITTDVYFSNDGNKKYFPDTTYSLPASALSYDSGSNQYYVDIDLVAEDVGVSYDITSGSLIYFSNFDPYFLHAEINYLKHSASDTETNSEFLARSKSAISTRNLVNAPSITSNLMEAFSIIDGVYSAGFGDPEMQRDYIKVSSPSGPNYYWMHQGGCIDVYCRVPLTSSVMQFTTDSSGKVYLTGPIYKVTRSTISGGPSPDTVPALTSYTFSNSNTSSKVINAIVMASGVVTVTVTNHGLVTGQRVKVSGISPSNYNVTKKIIVLDKDTFTYTVPGTVVISPTGSGSISFVDPSLDLGFTTKQNSVVDFGSLQANKTVSLILYFFQDIDGIQTYLENKDNRVLCANVMARGFNITLLDIALLSYDGVTPDSEVAATSIKKYLSSLNSGEPFVMSDLLSNLYSVGIKSLQNPVQITYNKYWKDGLTIDSGSITDYLEPDDSTNIFLLNNLTTDSTLINV